VGYGRTGSLPSMVAGTVLLGGHYGADRMSTGQRWEGRSWANAIRILCRPYWWQHAGRNEVPATA